MYLKISFAHGFVILTRTVCLFTFFKVLCHLKVLILRSKAKTGLEEIEERLGTWSVRLKNQIVGGNRGSVRLIDIQLARSIIGTLLFGGDENIAYNITFSWWLQVNIRYRLILQYCSISFLDKGKILFDLLPAWLMFLRNDREWRFLQLRACSVTERQRDSIL